jgi:phage shock protein PspC (stress-responsive transcriptional regulator)
MATKTLARPARGRMIAGVCAGIARRFGWPPLLVRAAFVISCVLPGPQVLIYLLLWVAMPRER